MGGYTLTFSLNSSTTQDAMVKDVNALGEFGDTEMPAVITTKSKQSNGNLIIATETIYDKEFILNLIKKKYENLKKLTATDIFLGEKTEAKFNTNTNWIISHMSVSLFKTNDMRVINETYVLFN